MHSKQVCRSTLLSAEMYAVPYEESTERSIEWGARCRKAALVYKKIDSHTHECVLLSLNETNPA